MTQSSLLIGYEPRCSVYPRKSGKRKVYYLSYYLPNGERIQRFCQEKKSLAVKLRHLKEEELLQGIFDELDLEKLGDYRSGHFNQKRLGTVEALGIYLNTTAENRGPKAQYNDERTLNMLFMEMEQSGHEFIDQITPLDVQLLINQYSKKGISEATLTYYKKGMSKVFKWLSEDMELVDMKNPLKKVKIPKKSGLVRDRIPTKAEMASLNAAAVEWVVKNGSPIVEIFKFISLTGARLGEVLHMEWEDFDEKTGIWTIRSKPRCPTFYGLGWKPKWGKLRQVPLFDEAIELLECLPRQQEVYGTVPVRDGNKEIIRYDFYPANFVFPIKVVDGKSGKVGYCRVNCIGNGWESLKKRARVENLQLKDLRTYFNHILKTNYNFTSKEAGAYIGNNEVVNELHYSPYHEPTIRGKMQKFPLKEALAGP
jgi:integrase